MIEVAPDFKMGDYESSLVDDGFGNRILPKQFEVKDHYVAMPCTSQTSPIVIPVDGSASVQFLIYHASFSRKSKVHVGLMFETMEERVKFKTIQTVARIRSEI